MMWDMMNGGVIVDSVGHLLYEKRCEEVRAMDLVQDLLAWGCPFAHVNIERNEGALNPAEQARPCKLHSAPYGRCRLVFFGLPAT